MLYGSGSVRKVDTYNYWQIITEQCSLLFLFDFRDRKDVLERIEINLELYQDARYVYSKPIKQRPEHATIETTN
jgi:hypothetical protein